MPDEPNSQSWWQTLPGVLTALAGVLTAIGALIVALHQVGIGFNFGTPGRSPTTETATTPGGEPSSGAAAAISATRPQVEGATDSGLQIARINGQIPAPDFPVGNLMLLEGTCPNPNMQIWVIELAEGIYWAKKRATITAGYNGSCTWNAEFHPDLRSGARVEVLAVGNPRMEMLEMKELFAWPPAQATSQSVTITLQQ